MKALCKSVNMPIGIPQPEWLLKLGAQVIGTETELVLKSRNVIPLRLLKSGFEFRYQQASQAIESLVL